MNGNSLHQNKTESGFTLVELLVALALFLIVMIISLGGLLKMLEVNRNVQALQVVMNNFNYTLEAMTRDIRFGEKYTCGQEAFGATEGINCDGSVPVDNSKMAVKFVELNGAQNNIAYRLQNGRIERCNVSAVCDPADWVPVTSQLIDINSLQFFVSGAKVPSEQGRVTIVIDGRAEVEGEGSDFTLQTTVSQREFRNSN